MSGRKRSVGLGLLVTAGVSVLAISSCRRTEVRVGPPAPDSAQVAEAGTPSTRPSRWVRAVIRLEARFPGLPVARVSKWEVADADSLLAPLELDAVLGQPLGDGSPWLAGATIFAERVDGVRVGVRIDESLEYWDIYGETMKVPPAFRDAFVAEYRRVNP